jgi:hypothetical protein
MGVLIQICGKRLDLTLVTTVEIRIGIGGVYKNFWQTFLTFYVLRNWRLRTVFMCRWSHGTCRCFRENFSRIDFMTPHLGAVAPE